MFPDRLVPECEHGMVFTCVPGHDWTRVVRKHCIYTNEHQAAHHAFTVLVNTQQKTNGAEDTLLILDGFQPYHIKDWCLRNDISTAKLRQLNVRLFFTNNLSPDTNLLQHLSAKNSKLFIRRTPTRRSERQRKMTRTQE